MADVVVNSGEEILHTHLYYLARDPLYEKEKPYSLRFQPPENFPVSNRISEKAENVPVYNIRGKEEQFTLERNGFEIIKVDVPLSPEDYHVKETVEKVYLKQLAHELKSKMGADRVQVFDYQLRQSHPEFPVATGGGYEHQQPATTVHVDTTSKWTKELIGNMNPDEPEILKQRYQFVNIWKPLAGPVKTWPLALCDNRTVDYDKDMVAGDIVFPSGPVEAYEVYHSPKHTFYYISDQQANEAWVFTQLDSYGMIAGVPHAAFPNPNTKPSDGTRASIEVRALVLYGEQKEN